MNVAFRVDAAPEIGSGHLRRCLCLADALRARGAHTRVVSRGLPPHLRALCDAGGHEVRELHEADGPGSGADIEPAAGGPAHARWLGTSQGADAAATRAVLAGASWDWLVVDHYGLDARWESALRPAAGRILAIDDLADRAHDCDVLLDQNLHVEPEARYAGKVPEASRLLLGPRFALLRPEFARARARVAERTGPVQRVLVAFGGADAANHTTAALQALAAAAGSTRPAVDVVVPAGHPHVAAIDAACRRDGFDCHVQSDRMADLMAAADVSVGAAGTMLWERCSVGLPALALAVAANQVAGLAAAARGGGQAGHLVGRDGERERGQPDRAALPQHRARRADRDVGRGHQVRHAVGLHVTVEAVASARGVDRGHVRMTGRHHHVNGGPRGARGRGQRLQRGRRVIGGIGAAEGDEHPLYRAGALGHTRTGAGELGPEQREARAEQQAAGLGHLARVPRLGLHVQVLIEQHVAVVRAVGQVVDRQDAPRRRSQRRLPARVEAVVVDHEPVPRRTGEHRPGGRRVGSLRRPQPARVRRTAGGRFDVRPGTRAVGLVQFPHLVPPGVAERPQVGRQASAHDARVRAARPERVGQAQAPPEMAGPDLRRRVDAEGDVHGCARTNPGRTGMPAAAIAALAPAGVCSVKWNMLAAATADAPPRRTTSIMWSYEPAPPEAITGIGTAAATSATSATS